MTSIAPLLAPLPAAPLMGKHFTADQWATLMAIADTIIPSVRRQSTVSAARTDQLEVSDARYGAALTHISDTVVSAPAPELIDEYLSESASSSPEFQALLQRTLIAYARDDARQQLAGLLSALDTRVGSLVLTGHMTPFRALSLEDRTVAFRGWRDSYIPALQGAFKLLTFATKNIYMKTSAKFYPVIGFPAVPEHYQPGASFEYTFLQFPAAQEPHVVDVDVVIVGSGCGGAVCAKNLAEAGHKVLVVDKSYHFTTEQLPMTEAAAGVHLYQNGGFEQSDDNSISVVAAAAWGGGGTVNWSASLQTQGYVRKEWSEDRGLKFFGTQEFQDCLDRVCNRMGASADHIRHNHGNQVLIEGARKLGYTCKAAPQNTAGQEHYCGHCTLGCYSGQKQGPVVSWLPDAAKAGAEFMEGFAVDRVLFDESHGTKKAVGIEGLWTSRNAQGHVDGPVSEKTQRKVVVRAKKVIISAGSVCSPIILLNSGLKNPHIGRNLYLHPCGFISAVFPEDVRPWEGGILTTVVSSFENQDNHGHGVKIETTCMLPTWSLTFLPWENGFDWKMQALKYRHMNNFICLAREREPGRVYQDGPSGLPRIEYTPSKFDRANIMRAQIACARMAHVQGATEITPLTTGFPAYVRDVSTARAAPRLPSAALPGTPEPEDPAFEAWLAAFEAFGNAPPRCAFASAHQMGSNRMAKSPKLGVVGPRGQVWGTEGLYVADASVFPSASGVNPMVTNMAISDWISRGIAKQLEREAAGVVQSASL